MVSATSRCCAPSCRSRSTFASFLVAGLDDPGPRRADLLQLCSHLGGQSLVLDGHAGGAADRFDEPGVLLVDRAVVDEDGERLAVAFDPRDRPVAVLGGQLDRMARAVDVAGRIRSCEGELERRIPERPGQRVAQPAGR